MPIRIPDALPATALLEAENIFVMTEKRAIHQDIRTLKILLLNLMPTKIATENQILRKLSNTPLQMDVELLRIASHESSNTSPEHLETFYRTFDEIRDRNFDGMIITGAPVERLEFAQVDYWDELCEIMAWTRQHVHATLHICWGAQAGIYYHYGVEKRELPGKLTGIFSHEVMKPSSPWVRGFDDVFYAPHSRYTDIPVGVIAATPGLEVIAASAQAGAYMVKSTDSRNFFALRVSGEYAQRDDFRPIVIGVDNQASSIRDARENARHNGIDNAQFKGGDAGTFLRKLAKDSSEIGDGVKTADRTVVFMDPPRAGASEDFLKALGIFMPKTIVYISCNMKTQARDLRKLVNFGYTIDVLQPVDMFPHTPHLETVALLTRP